MSRLTAPQVSVTAAIAVFAVTSAIFTTRAESESLIDATNTTEAKIAGAKSAGPPEIARFATIVAKDADGHTVVLRRRVQRFYLHARKSERHRPAADVRRRTTKAVVRGFCSS